jgi:hypothetical protein
VSEELPEPLAQEVTEYEHVAEGADPFAVGECAGVPAQTACLLVMSILESISQPYHLLCISDNIQLLWYSSSSASARIAHLTTELVSPCCDSKHAPCDSIVRGME